MIVMLETIFYYTWWVFLITIIFSFSIYILFVCLSAISMIAKNIKVYSTFYIKYAQMNENEKIMSENLYESIIKWKKEKINKYFNNQE